MATHDEDPVDEMRAVGMTSAAALSRIAEVLIRNAQDAQLRQGSDQREAGDALARRYEAQAQLAEQYFTQVAGERWMREAEAAEAAHALRAAQAWAEVDSGRFTRHADAIHGAYTREHGTEPTDGREAGDGNTAGNDGDGYDSAERRARDDAAMRAAGVGEEAREAKLIADHLNAQHPHEAAGPMPARAKSAPPRAARPKTRTRPVERGR